MPDDPLALLDRMPRRHGVGRPRSSLRQWVDANQDAIRQRRKEGRTWEDLAVAAFAAGFLMADGSAPTYRAVAALWRRSRLATGVTVTEEPNLNYAAEAPRSRRRFGTLKGDEG